MTREEAYKDCLTIVQVKGRYIPEMLEQAEYLVDKIYDDFEMDLLANVITINTQIGITEMYKKELCEIKSRICENCIYSKYEEGNQADGLTWVEESCDVFGDGFVPSMIDNKGCNKWASK